MPEHPGKPETATVADYAEHYDAVPLGDEIVRVAASLRDDRPLPQLRVWSPLLTAGLLEVVAQTMTAAGFKVVTYVLAACGGQPQIDGLDLPCCLHTAPALARFLKLEANTVRNQISFATQLKLLESLPGRVRPNGAGGWRFVAGTRRHYRVLVPGWATLKELPDLWAGPQRPEATNERTCRAEGAV